MLRSQPGEVKRRNRRKDWTEARRQLDKELARLSWLNPVSVKMFGGKFDPSTLRFPFDLLPGMKKLPEEQRRTVIEEEGWILGVSQNARRAGCPQPWVPLTKSRSPRQRHKL